MKIGTNKDRGRAGLSQAIAYFGTNGYTVSIPLNDTQWYDLIVEKNGVFQTVQCKFTDSKRGTVDLRETGGVNGGIFFVHLGKPTVHGALGILNFAVVKAPMAVHAVFTHLVRVQLLA